MGLFSKKPKEPLAPPPVAPISDADLVEASRIMDRWDQAMGTSDAIWDCLEVIGRRGGYAGDRSIMDAVASGYDAGEVIDRPWRWWAAAARTSAAKGEHELPGRIFLFTHMFATQLAASMNVGNEMETGLSRPQNATYREIADIAAGSLATLDPAYLIHDTATGKVDVAAALRMATGVRDGSA